MEIELSEIEIKNIINALYFAKAYEENFIDCYSVVNDGSEIKIIKNANINIKNWEILSTKLQNNIKVNNSQVMR